MKSGVDVTQRDLTIRSRSAWSVGWRATSVVALVATTIAIAVTLMAPVRAATVFVGADDDLQRALDDARPGDILLLQAGARFTGNFVLPAKDGNRPILVRSATTDSRLPGGSDRIGPEHSPLLPKLVSPNNQPALRTAPGASGWRLVALEFVGTGQAGDLIALGDGSTAQRREEQIARDLILDRLLIRGDPERGHKRGIALNSAETTIRNSYIADIKSLGQEAQAIAGWNGPGPFVIENNYLQAAGVNILFGGSDPAVPDLVPSDIIIRRNHITKDPEWRGTRWTVKNLLELKNAKRVLITGYMNPDLLSRGASLAKLSAVLLKPTSMEHIRKVLDDAMAAK